MPFRPRKNPKPMHGITPPPLGAPPPPAQTAPTSESKDPLMVRVFTWYIFIRAGLYFLTACLIVALPDSALHVLLQHADSFARILPQHGASFDSYQRLRDFISFRCVFMAGIYALIGWRWAIRYWLARWGFMFVAGASALNTAVSLLFSGTTDFTNPMLLISRPAPISPHTMSLLVGSICLNLAICFYLMFYPGVERAFERPLE
ncbi:MAG: hypothetical protein KGN79_12295 [Acidobacteriota bacterium]|nr:hypothetical protein [Acidobacteriota bacterium]